MSDKALTSEIKTRVPPSIKEGFATLAAERDLKPADLQREAFREFLSKKRPSKRKIAAA